MFEKKNETLRFSENKVPASTVGTKYSAGCQQTSKIPSGQQYYPDYCSGRLSVAVDSNACRLSL